MLASALVLRLKVVGLETPNLCSIGLGRIGIKVLREIRNQDVSFFRLAPVTHTFWESFPVYVVFVGPPPMMMASEPT